MATTLSDVLASSLGNRQKGKSLRSGISFMGPIFHIPRMRDCTQKLILSR
jgi:hypothetical protein